jgi:phosphoribosylcarboxyaminoimidazole (NCAIR) mutase
LKSSRVFTHPIHYNSKSMTQKDIKNFLEKRTCGSLEQTVTTEEGLEAIEMLTEVAEANGIDFIIAGGLAVKLYGFTRATTDADVLASAILPIESFRQLTFGGESYKVQISNGKTVVVNWIMRDD